MILYGYKHRNIEWAAGHFVCPKCSADRTFKHIKVVRYFTLFFIPLFPLGTVASYIECQTCRTAFKPEELAATRGNEQFTRELQERTAEADKVRKAGRGRTFAIIGGILLALGCCFFSFATGAQLTEERGMTYNLEGYLGLMAICPLPLMLAGLGLLIWGIHARRSVTEPVDMLSSPPIA